MTKLQPPPGTVIETREEAIRVLLSPEYAEFTYCNYHSSNPVLKDVYGVLVDFQDIFNSLGLPYRVTGVLPDFTPDPNYGKTKLVEVPADAPTLIQKRGEEVTIKAGEVSYNDFQDHVDNMGAMDVLNLVDNPELLVRRDQHPFSPLSMVDPEVFPARLLHNFTYTPVYPANTPTTDRWLDQDDVRDKAPPRDNEQFLLLMDDEETVMQAVPYFCVGATEMDYWYCDSIYGRKAFYVGLDEVVAVKPISWVLNPTSDKSKADAKRFADVKTWEGGQDA